MATDQELTNVSIPIVEETVTVGKKKKITGKVVATTSVIENALLIDEPLVCQNVEVEKRTVDRWVDTPVPVRQEGGTTIISVMEEVVVVERRWKVVEEIRLTKHETIQHQPQQVVVRRTDVTVERLPGDPEGSG